MTAMKALRFAHYGPPSVLSLLECEIPQPGPGESLVQVEAAAINPSDVKNVAGAFKAPLPRTPGRDYAGIVVAGEGKGREVWGSGPAFGAERDGSHAQFVLLRVDWLADKPARLTMEQAAAIGVPFLVAWNGLIDEGRVQAGETVLVTGAGGAVGRAVTQIARWKGARVIGADIANRSSVADVFINTREKDLMSEVHAVTGGRGADLAYDAVGGPMFEPCLRSLALGGRQLAITSIGDRRVSFDLLDFYHNRLHLIGVDSMQLGGCEIARIFDALRPGFDSGQLKPFEVQSSALDRAVEAYAAVEKGGGSARHVLLPQTREMM
ncbi:MAG TPA: zinc-binding alcohol dehydrogenase family protein [Rhizomicrobium sp.]|nr:zinc-binding alcohol dehydrogenase family protein [Rhizomicrobium sp.]